jgi:hypothetical protein
MDYDLIQRLEWLLETANISPEMERRIRSVLYELDNDSLHRCRKWLLENQHEPTNPGDQNAARWVRMGYWKMINCYDVIESA